VPVHEVEIERSATDAPEPQDPGVSAGARTPALRVQLLGSFAVWVDGRLVEEGEWHRRKVSRLVKLLALAERHSMHREQIQAHLWPDFDASSASQNLHHTLYRARRALEPGLSRRAQPRFLQFRNEMIILARPADVEIDLELFEDASATALHTPDAERCRRAIALHTGELLPDERYEEWAIERADRARATLIRLLRRVGALERASGSLEPAIEALQRVVGIEPLNEEAQGELLELLGLAGRRHQAIAHYERLCATYKRELNTTPDPRTVEAYRGVLSGEIAPAVRVDVQTGSEATALRADPALLPTPVSRFVGRDAEIAELLRLLAGERLVTLLGPGGVGKTRLAIEVARALDGVGSAWLVQLGNHHDPCLVAGALVASMKLSPPLGVPLTDVLASALQDSNALLMLDTCEHVRSGVAALAAELLERCSKLRIIATSRQPLGLFGEVLWRVPPLSIPGTDASFQTGEIARSEAVQLFVDRCRAVQPGFELRPDNAQHVAEVCRRLEGIPLAMELAAARVRVVTVSQLAARLDARLPLLVGGSDAAARRHRTLRSTIEWSHDLLSNSARLALRRLATFSGGWTLEGAERVACDTDLPAERVLDALTELVDQSLVRAEPEDGSSRYSMLDTVREFAMERLHGAGEVEATRDHHLEYFLAFAETMPGERLPASAVQTGWFDRLTRDHGNLASALDWALVQRRDRERGLRLAHALRWYLMQRGRFEEGQRWLEPILLDPAQIPSRLLAHTTLTVALFTWRQGDYQRALTLTMSALPRFRELDDPWGLALSTCLAGMLKQLLGDVETGVALTEESLERYRALGDAHGIQWQLVILARAAIVQRNADRAAELAEEGLRLCRTAGHGVGEGWALAYLGFAWEAKGDYAQAEDAFRQSLLRLSEDDFWGGDVVRVALVRVTARQGDLTGAAAAACEAMTRLRGSGSEVELARLFHAFAVLALMSGDARRAAQLLGAVERLGAGGAAMDPNLVSDDMLTIRAALGNERFEAELQAGRDGALEDMIALAIGLTPPTGAGLS
jgi:predicted ATPase/DNA-binding SARP family transcriptional activator